MKNLTDRPPMSRTDKLCLVALAGCFLAPNLAVWAMDTAAIRATEADKPPAITTAAPAMDFTPLFEAAEAHREEFFWETIPLNGSCRDALQEACEAHGVPLHIALGVIEVESGFDPEAVSSEGCVGLMQLNTKYFPAGLSPEDNIRAGVAHLGALLERYDGDIQASLCAYNKGYDDGGRRYARAVLDASEKWVRG